MPHSTNRSDLRKLGAKKPPYFLFFVLSVIFVALSLLAYNYAIARLSKELVIYNTSNLSPTSVEIITPQPTVTPSQTPVETEPTAPEATTSPKVLPTPTPEAPYLKTYQNDQFKFKVDYWSTRTLFTDQTSTTNRFVFTHPDGNFVVHLGQADWTWVHSGRELTSKFTLLGQPTFVFETTSQKLVDFKSPSGLFFTIQCVHNGLEALITECDQFIQSFAFLN